jgi:hypothetical protein
VRRVRRASLRAPGDWFADWAAEYYVNSYDLAARKFECNPEQTQHDKISIVEVPKRNPAASRVIAEPVLFPDGGNDGTSGTRRATTGCHDITIYPAIDLAAGACTGEGVLMDISDPEDPKVLSNIEDENFAFWHSATISHDGNKVLFTDELGGGSQAVCNETVGPQRGADAIYDITDPANPWPTTATCSRPRTATSSSSPGTRASCRCSTGPTAQPARDRVVRSRPARRLRLGRLRQRLSRGSRRGPRPDPGRGPRPPLPALRDRSPRSRA